MFWSSVDLTGNQTTAAPKRDAAGFWSSVDLTGNQTAQRSAHHEQQFWSSVDLTGNQTYDLALIVRESFGAVSI